MIHVTTEVQVYPYFFIAAVIAGLWISESMSLEPLATRWNYLAGAASGVIGGRVLFSLQYGFSEVGFSFYGFFAGAGLGVALCHRWRHHRWAKTDFPDAVIPAVALGSAIHRIGCFLNGCCFGKVCRLPWAVTYGLNKPVYLKHLQEGWISPEATSSLPVHPTQLYETVTWLSLFGVLLWMGRSPRFSFLRYELPLGTAIFYSLFRFGLEFLRDDAGGTHFGWLTFAQLMSLLLFVAASSVLIIRRRQYRRGDHSLLRRPPVPAGPGARPSHGVWSGTGVP